MWAWKERRTVHLHGVSVWLVQLVNDCDIENTMFIVNLPIVSVISKPVFSSPLRSHSIIVTMFERNLLCANYFAVSDVLPFRIKSENPNYKISVLKFHHPVDPSGKIHFFQALDSSSVERQGKDSF